MNAPRNTLNKNRNEMLIYFTSDKTKHVKVVIYFPLAPSVISTRAHIHTRGERGRGKERERKSVQVNYKSTYLLHIATTVSLY